MEEVKARDIIDLITRASGGEPARLGDSARLQVLQYARKSELYRKWKASDDYAFTTKEALKLLKKFVRKKWKGAIHNLDAQDIIVSMQTELNLPVLG